MRKPVAYFDLDGTLADFDSAMRDAMLQIASPEEIAKGSHYYREQPNEPRHIKERRRLVKRSPGFWSNLKPYPSVKNLLSMALDLGYRVEILTRAPRNNPPAWKEKVEWCHLHLPMHKGIGLNLVEDKGLVRGQILVDDWPEYIMAWAEGNPFGHIIVPARPWNESFFHARATMATLEFSDLVDIAAINVLKNAPWTVNR